MGVGIKPEMGAVHVVAVVVVAVVDEERLMVDSSSAGFLLCSRGSGEVVNAAEHQEEEDILAPSLPVLPLGLFLSLLLAGSLSLSWWSPNKVPGN